MPRATKVAQQGEQTRTVILDSAVALFGEKGFRATSMNDIAKHAGVVQSVLHHHFGSKDGLLIETLRRYYPTSTGRADIQAIAKGEVDFFDEMIRITRLNSSRPDLVRFFSVMSGEALTRGHPAAEFFVQRYDSVREGYVAAIAEAKGITDPEITKKIAALVSRLFAVSDGLQMQWLRNASIDYVGELEETIAMIRQRMEAVL